MLTWPKLEPAPHHMHICCFWCCNSVSGDSPVLEERTGFKGCDRNAVHSYTTA